MDRFLEVSRALKASNIDQLLITTMVNASKSGQVIKGESLAQIARGSGHNIQNLLIRARNQGAAPREIAAGGRAAAVAYIFIETAKLNGVDPQTWLADTIARIPDYKITKVQHILPWKAK